MGSVDWRSGWPGRVRGRGRGRDGRDRWARSMGERSPVEQPLRVVIARGGGDGDDGGDERICGADDDDGEALDLVVDKWTVSFKQQLSTAAEAATDASTRRASKVLRRHSAGSGLRTCVWSGLSLLRGPHREADGVVLLSQTGRTAFLTSCLGRTRAAGRRACSTRRGGLRSIPRFMERV